MAFWFHLVSVHISPFCELARWLLERQGIPYHESCHAPIFNVPVISAPDATLGIRELLDYLDARARNDERLFPHDPEQNRDARELTQFILTDLAIAVRLYTFAQMLPNRRVTGALITARAPWVERALVAVLYPLQAWAMRRALGINPSSTLEARKLILSSFDSVSKRIRSDNGFLTGDQLTVADLAFAASVALVTLPPEYAAPFPQFSDLPPEMQATVQAVHATPAGRLALRIYRDYRTPRYRALDSSPSAGARWTDRLAQSFQRALGSPRLLRIASRFLRLKPVLKLGKTTIISTHGEVVHALVSDRDFTIAEINGERMNRISGPFILGMDRSAEYDRESAAIRSIVRPADLDWIRRIVRDNAQSLIGAARPYSRLDLAGSYARVCGARVVAEYFGVPGPCEHILMQWMRSLFWDVFQNRGDDPIVRRAADRCAQQLRDYLTALIAKRQADGATGEDILSRLIRAGTLDPEGIRRNITGIIVGAIDTTVTAAANAFTVLFDKPEALEQAAEAAQNDDENQLRQCVYEALRFRPQTPALLRYKKSDNTTALLLTISGMFDPEAFSDAGSFRVDRPLDRYIHFGHGMHTCYGHMINGVQLPQLACAILRQPNVRRSHGRFGKVIYEGPFPDRLVVEFGATQ